jgi:hypothetical protein
MNLESAMILTGALVVLGGIGMSGFVIWLRSRDARHRHDGPKHA